MSQDKHSYLDLFYKTIREIAPNVKVDQFALCEETMTGSLYLHNLDDARWIYCCPGWSQYIDNAAFAANNLIDVDFIEHKADCNLRFIKKISIKFCWNDINADIQIYIDSLKANLRDLIDSI